MRSLVALLCLALPLQAGTIGAEDATRLEHFVQQDCGACHGLTMKGGLGRAITPDALAGTHPEVLSDIIMEGVPGTAMPPWKSILSRDEADWIAEYLLKDH